MVDAHGWILRSATRLLELVERLGLAYQLIPRSFMNWCTKRNGRKKREEVLLIARNKQLLREELKMAARFQVGVENNPGSRLSIRESIKKGTRRSRFISELWIIDRDRKGNPLLCNSVFSWWIKIVPVWKFCHGASQAPTRQTRAPTRPEPTSWPSLAPTWHRSLPVWKCHDASQAPTRKNRAPTWVSRLDQIVHKMPNPTRAYLMAEFGPNLAPFTLWVLAILNQFFSPIKICILLFLWNN